MTLSREKTVQPLLFYVTVAVTGAAVLILEVAAIRLFAPYYGASLLVISSVLSTILAALSLGYFIGGRLADRFPSPRVLYTLLSVAGLSMLLLYVGALAWLPTMSTNLSVTWGPIVLSVLFFFVPAWLLGMDSPFVVRLLSGTHATDAGTVAGTVFFVSTVGSIVGSLLAGFYLIPTFGVGNTIITTAAILAVGSILVRLYLKSRKILLPVTFLIFCIGVTYLAWHWQQFQNNQYVYYDDGYYTSIRVYDQTIGGTDYRFLQRDSNHSSAIRLGSPESVYSYTQAMLSYQLQPIAPGRALVLGGGAYTLPRALLHADTDLTVDVVELEPSLYQVAQTYFDLPTSDKLTNHVVDARVYLQNTEQTYDLIFSDVMNAGNFIAPHLSTVEYFAAIRDRLAPGGLAYINTIGVLHQTDENLTDALYETITTVFPNHQVLAITDPTSTQLQNIVYVVRKDTDQIQTVQHPIVRPFSGNTAVLSNLLLPSTYKPRSNSPILTDQKNPSEQLLARRLLQDK